MFLALVPLALALWLFRRTERRGLLWWPLLLVFVAFLPNAAYTLTDVIHLIEEIRAQPLLPIWSVVYIVLPKYALFMFVGFQCHVISLMRLGDYLRWLGHKNWVLPAELLLNFLCAIGVYWGRYLRFNSWDLVTDPQKIAGYIVHEMVSQFSALTILRYFVAISAFYFAVKLINLALWEYWQRRRQEGLGNVLPQWASFSKPRASEPSAQRRDT